MMRVMLHDGERMQMEGAAIRTSKAGQTENSLEKSKVKAPVKRAPSPFDASWAAADDLYQSLGIHHGFDGGDSAMDSRDEDEVYRDAMDAHFREKGLMV